MTPTFARPAAETVYGSDRVGLVWGYVFESSGAGRAISSDEATVFLQGSDAPPGFLWLHFSLSNAASTQWLREHLTLPDAFFERPKDQSSTRIEVIDEALVGVLNDVQFFAAEASSASTVALHVTSRLFVSARTTQLRAIDRLRTAVKADERFRSTAELLAHLLRDQADVLVDVVRDATRQVDACEDRIISHQQTNRSQLGALRRVLVRLQRLLAPEPAALFRLMSRPPSWLSEADVADLRQSAEEMSAAVADSGVVVERIRLLQEELTALLNEQTNRTLFILTVVTVLALPMTIIPGMFGMNVRDIPLADRTGGFWLVLTVVVAVMAAGAGLAWSRFRDL